VESAMGIGQQARCQLVVVVAAIGAVEERLNAADLQAPAHEGMLPLRVTLSHTPRGQSEDGLCSRAS
jgi:hypothetical protein